MANPGLIGNMWLLVLVILFILILVLVHTLPFIFTIALVEIRFFAKHAKQL